jgi:hypothetical protein
VQVGIDRTKPSLPSELLQFPLEDIDILDFPTQLEELWGEILVELQHPTWAGRAHNNRGTYDQGCRGPLCRKAIRENSRRKRDPADILPELTYRHLDPIMEYYHMIAKLRLERYRVARIMAIRQAG